MPYTEVNPYNGKTIREFPNTTNSQLNEFLNQATIFYQKAQVQPVKEREILLERLANEFENHMEKYAQILTVNMGKLIGEARSEVKKNITFAHYYAENGSQLLKPQSSEILPNGNAQIEFSGTGIVLAIEPWNFPYTQVMRVFAPNFILGNPVVLKHASIVPGAAQAFQNACDNAGLPKGAFSNVFINYNQVNSIISDSRVQGIALTGSENAGKRIAATAGSYLKKTTLELGGTDIFAVLDDANIDRAATDATTARLSNAGQVCTSAKRYLVSDDIYDQFLLALKKKFSTYQVGDPLDEKTTLAPLSSKKAKVNLLEQVRMAISGGASLLYGDLESNETQDNEFSPLILTGMTPNNPMYDEELFGPVAQIYRVKSDNEIVTKANRSRHGLGGAIYTSDIERGKRLASRIATGQVAINHILSSQAGVPFGGIKNSGYGRELSNWGIYEFANIKAIIY